MRTCRRANWDQQVPVCVQPVGCFRPSDFSLSGSFCSDSGCKWRHRHKMAASRLQWRWLKIEQLWGTSRWFHHDLIFLLTRVVWVCSLVALRLSRSDAEQRLVLGGQEVAPAANQLWSVAQKRRQSDAMFLKTKTNHTDFYLHLPEGCREFTVWLQPRPSWGSPSVVGATVTEWMRSDRTRERWSVKALPATSPSASSLCSWSLSSSCLSGSASRRQAAAAAHVEEEVLTVWETRSPQNSNRWNFVEVC